MKTKGALWRISPEMRTEIDRQALSDNSPRQSLAQALAEEWGDKAPSLDTIAKEISKVRSKERKTPPVPLWDIGSLSQQDLHPAVVPILLRAQSECRNITISQALWCSRLYSTVADLLSKNKKAIPESVIWWGTRYAFEEKLSLYSSVPLFQTGELDSELLERPDHSVDTWMKQVREGKAPVIHCSRIPDVDFKRREKIRKQRRTELDKGDETKVSPEEDIWGDLCGSPEIDRLFEKNAKPMRFEEGGSNER